MKIENDGQKLIISDIPELTTVNAGVFREQVLTALPEEVSAVVIDLSQTRFVDSSGLGALFALYRNTREPAGVALRLLNPRPEIQQLLELMQMHQLFEIILR
jgi:anti-sigma B factor antagonist